MRILLTGASGFVGLNLLESWLAAGHAVAAAANSAISARALRVFETLPGKLFNVSLDVRDEASTAALFRDFRPEWTVVGAAITPGQSAEASSFEGLIEVNIHGAVRAVRLAKEFGCSRALFLSSASVYGSAEPLEDELDEDRTAPRPSAGYGIAKFSAEQFCLRFGETNGFDVRSARIGTVFGPWEADTGVRETLSPIYQVMEFAAAGKEVVLPRAGKRDFIYSRDVAGALTAILAANNPPHRLFNVGLGREWTVAEWCERMAQDGGLRWRYCSEANPANVTFHSPVDRPPLSTRRLAQELGYVPQFDFDAAFRDYQSWFFERQNS